MRSSLDAVAGRAAAGGAASTVSDAGREEPGTAAGTKHVSGQGLGEAAGGKQGDVSREDAAMLAKLPVRLMSMACVHTVTVHGNAHAGKL